jgi:hypothetical protein
VDFLHGNFLCVFVLNYFITIERVLGKVVFFGRISLKIYFFSFFALIFYTHNSYYISPICIYLYIIINALNEAEDT